MLSEKLPININFAQGLDTKTDPKQVSIGKFVELVNSQFTTAGLLEKRPGYPALSAVPNSTARFLTTFNGGLTAIGESVQAYSRGSNSFVDRGYLTPISLSVQPSARSARNIIQSDAVVASNGLVCTVHTEYVSSFHVSNRYYSIKDVTTGQTVVAPTLLLTTGGSTYTSPRVFILGGYFVIVYGVRISSTNHLQYIRVSINNPTSASAVADLVADLDDSGQGSWDGVVVDGKLYFAFSSANGGQHLTVTYLDTAWVVAAGTDFNGITSDIMTVCADMSGDTPAIYVTYYDDATPSYSALAVDTVLNTLMSPTLINNADHFNNMASTAQDGVLTVVSDLVNAYSYDSNTATDYLQKVEVTLPATVTTGSVGSISDLIRSVGLASKGFLFDGEMYMLTSYDGKSATVSAFQPTYFLINIDGQIISRLAYQNGGGYLPYGLPSAMVVDDTVYISYLFKTLIQAVNKTQGAASSTGVYAQTGVNLASFSFDNESLFSAEIGNNLNFSGGMGFAYDGALLNEQGFNLYPDSIKLTVATSGGSMTTQNYFYQVIYQWTDAQGNIIRSAPSIPKLAASGSFTGSSNKVTIEGPTLRLSYKTHVEIIIYRWSAAQQSYYQVTSLTSPLLNNPATDSFSFVDTLADASIIGNSLIYTTGGVLENTPGPACKDVTLFDTRLWSISAEDGNLLGYSKQVIESVPVENSDFLTFYVAPNAGTSETTGPMKCIAPMDDKLIIFKNNSIFYINGSGPDNTGSNSQYSQAIFITSVVGCTNKKSIVLTGAGLMFQSDKGIWLLDRNLGTQYIGAPVEQYNSYSVTSANSIPKTTMVVFTLSNGVTLMYDYFYGQWGTWEGFSAASACIFEDFHTVITTEGLILQQDPTSYLDNGNPVLQRFTTGWINVAKLMGFQRFYYFMFVGQYFSPHKLYATIAYDYNSDPVQPWTITPDNFSAIASSPFGDQSSPFGSSVDLEQWQLNPRRQKCQAFQLSMQEIYDDSLGVAAGAGLSISGLNLMARVKRTTRPLRATQTVG